MQFPRRWIFLLLCCLPVASAYGSGDLFYFEASSGDFHFTLMMIGREDPGAVQVTWTGKPSAAPSRRYHVEMNRAKKRLYVRPASVDGQPWFELEVAGNQGELLFRRQRMHGPADWTTR